MRLHNNHLRAISQEIPQPSITKVSWKITFLNFHSNLPGANVISLPVCYIFLVYIYRIAQIFDCIAGVKLLQTWWKLSLLFKKLATKWYKIIHMARQLLIEIIQKSVNQICNFLCVRPQPQVRHVYRLTPWGLISSDCFQIVQQIETQNGPIDVCLQVMTWCWTCAKPLP